MKRPCSEYLSDAILDFATCTYVILTVSTYMEVFPVLILKTFVNEIHRKDKIPQLHIYFLQIFSLTRQNSATSRVSHDWGESPLLADKTAVVQPRRHLGIQWIRRGTTGSTVRLRIPIVT